MNKFEILQELLKYDGEILSEQSLWEKWRLWIYSMQVYKKLQFVKKDTICLKHIKGSAIKQVMPIIT